MMAFMDTLATAPKINRSRIHPPAYKSRWPKILKAFRKKMCWSQEAAAKGIGVERRSVNRWERGDSIPQRVTVKLLVTLFEKHAPELLKQVPKREIRKIVPAGID